MFDFTAESFDLEKTNEYILSIQISLDGFSFSVLSPQENKIVAFKCTPLKISSDNLILRHFNEWLKEEVLFQRKYLKTVFIYFTIEFSLIPENIYNSKLVQEATSQLIPENDLKQMEVNTITGLETPAKIVFYLPKDLKEIIIQHFSSSELIHPVQLITQQIPQTHKKNKVVLLYHKKSCILFAASNNQILLANGFNTGHVNDLVYYVLNTITQLNLNPKETDFYLSEALIKSEELEQLLHPYFPEIFYLSPIESVENAGMIPNSLHRYFSPV